MTRPATGAVRPETDGLLGEARLTETEVCARPLT